MKQFWSGVVAASFVATVGLAAQNNPPGSASPGSQGGASARPSTSAQASASGKSMTISGCIQSAPAATATAGAAGASASASAGSKFVLANAKMPSTGSSSSAVGTSGTSSRYQLQGDEKQISAHLNHQVEITGTLESASAAGGAAAGSPSAAGGSSTSGANAPTLKVESVKMVSATCS
jgi:hypothetical protein